MSTGFFISRLPIGLELISRGHEVHLATTFTNKEKFFKLKGFIMNFKFLSKKNFINLIQNFLVFFRLIILVKPTLVHAITIKPVILAGIASNFLKYFYINIWFRICFYLKGESSQKSKKY